MFAGQVGHAAIVLLVVIGICVIAGIIARQMGVAIPDWVVQIFWVIVVVVVGVLAIHFLVGWV